MRIVEALPGADERVVVISSPDDPSQDRNSAEVSTNLMVIASDVCAAENDTRQGQHSKRWAATFCHFCTDDDESSRPQECASALNSCELL